MKDSTTRLITISDIAISVPASATAYQSSTNEIIKNNVEIQQYTKNIIKIVRSQKYNLHNPKNTTIKYANNIPSRRSVHPFEIVQTDMDIKGIHSKVQIPKSNVKASSDATSSKIQNSHKLYANEKPFSMKDSTTGTITTPSIAISAHASATAYQSGTNEIIKNKIEIRHHMKHIIKITRSHKNTLCSIKHTALKYANNTPPQRGGHLFETVHGKTLQTDMDIKGIPGKVQIPKSNVKASPDVICGKNQSSHKLYADAKSSAYAQSNPAYGNQQRIVSSDQLKKAKEILEQRASREALRGRLKAAEQHRKTAALLDDRIRTPEGAESTPLTRKQALELADSVRKEKTGKPVIDIEKIKKVLGESGETKKINTAIKKRKYEIQKHQNAMIAAKKKRIRSEITGAGKAAVIGALTAGGITAAMMIQQNGIHTESLQTAAIEAGKSATEGGLVSLGTYGVTRTVGVAASKVVSNALKNTGFSLTANVSSAIQIGVLGAVTTVPIAAYTFTRLKLSGETATQAFKQTVKSSAVSIGITSACAITTACFGMTAGIVVSVAIGIGTVFYSLFKSHYSTPKVSMYNHWNYLYS